MLNFLEKSKRIRRSLDSRLFSNLLRTVRRHSAPRVNDTDSSFDSALYICPSKTLSSFLLFVGNNIENVDFRNRIVKILSVSVPKYTPQNGTITSIRNLEELITASRETLFGPSAGTELEDLRIRETVERFILVRSIFFFDRSGSI